MTRESSADLRANGSCWRCGRAWCTNCTNWWNPAKAEEIIEAISKALRLYSVKKKQRQMENPQTDPAQRR